MAMLRSTWCSLGAAWRAAPRMGAAVAATTCLESMQVLQLYARPLNLAAVHHSANTTGTTATKGERTGSSANFVAPMSTETTTVLPPARFHAEDVNVCNPRPSFVLRSCVTDCCCWVFGLLCSLVVTLVLCAPLDLRVRPRCCSRSPQCVVRGHSAVFETMAYCRTS